jgi:DNA modification methylase
MLIRADARALPLIDGCVDCVVTSPPYFGLRDYGVAAQIGLEPTPDAYVAALVAVFRDVRRVLNDNGTCWLNIGDSYASVAGIGRTGVTGLMMGGVDGCRRSLANRQSGARLIPDGYKSKDLIGIPWMVAFALRADGWYLRSDIIWSKPNPMPESVTDRPTKAHEYLFLLTKSERYFYDADAIRERAVKTGTLKHLAGGGGERAGSREGLRRDEWMARKRVQEPGSQPLTESEVSGHPLYTNTKPYTGKATKDYAKGGAQDPSAVKARIVEKILAGELDGRNRRSVWTIPTQPYAGAHFATMPEALVEPCVLAGCPLGGLVLDPFVGSGTVGAVAERLGRRWVGTDLSYQPLAKKRTQQRGIRFSQGTGEPLRDLRVLRTSESARNE